MVIGMDCNARSAGEMTSPLMAMLLEGLQCAQRGRDDLAPTLR
jgi:hypothetical protein